MKIREESKKIVQYLLDEAINHGNLHREIVLKNEDLAKNLGFESTEHLKVCIQYLSEKEIVAVSKVNNERRMSLTANAIDFIELQ